MGTEAEREELERIRRRKARAKQMRLEKEKAIRRQKLIKKLLPVLAVALVIFAVGITAIVHTVSASVQAGKASGVDAGKTQETDAGTAVVTASLQTESDEAAGEEQESDQAQNDSSESESPEKIQPTVSLKQYSAQETSRTAAPPSEVNSSNVIFLERESNDILAARDCHTVINPASMTKVLTILVAAEHIVDLDDTFTMTAECTDYSYVHDCSNAGFEKNEQVTVRDLFYGTILPSGGEAAVGLATYVAGSHEAFVELMNRKLEILGLSDTAHFTNCVGIYDKDHHCTVYDMAMIMEAALDNELCREVLSAHTYTTSATAEHPEGLLLSNWFLRRIEDQDTGGEVVCGKTGFVDQSGNCSVSYGVDLSGKEYICVTTGAQGSWRCIYDHAALYKKYAKEPG